MLTFIRRTWFTLTGSSTIANDANYTETLEAILDFFEKYSINSFVPFDDSVHSLHLLIDKRMDAIEAI